MRTCGADSKMYRENVDKVPRDLCDTTSRDMSIESLIPTLATLSSGPVVPIVASIASSALTSALINRRNNKRGNKLDNELDAEIARIDRERAKLDAESRRYYRESSNKSSNRSSNRSATKKTSSRDLSAGGERYKKDSLRYYNVVPNSRSTSSFSRRYDRHSLDADDSYGTLIKYGEVMDDIWNDIRNHFNTEETEQYIGYSDDPRDV